jgi:hypothetical protein
VAWLYGGLGGLARRRACGAAAEGINKRVKKMKRHPPVSLTDRSYLRRHSDGWRDGWQKMQYRHGY